MRLAALAASKAVAHVGHGAGEFFQPLLEVA